MLEKDYIPLFPPQNLQILGSGEYGIIQLRGLDVLSKLCFVIHFCANIRELKSGVILQIMSRPQNEELL